MCLQCFALQDFAGAGGDVGCTNIGSPCVVFVCGGARRCRRAPSRPGWRHSVVHHRQGCADVAARSGAAFAQSKVDGGPVEGPPGMDGVRLWPSGGYGPCWGVWTYCGHLVWQQEHAGVTWNVTHSDAVINDGVLAICCCVVPHGDTVISDGGKQVLASSVLT
ncbi:hypothetical protein K439DRAFT_1619355 [Ramaria rubella]|nr:hypothetical protein K439DRAFT_1619355 [Ramaria rubella]